MSQESRRSCLSTVTVTILGLVGHRNVLTTWWLRKRNFKHVSLPSMIGYRQKARRNNGDEVETGSGRSSASRARGMSLTAVSILDAKPIPDRGWVPSSPATPCHSCLPFHANCFPSTPCSNPTTLLLRHDHHLPCSHSSRSSSAKAYITVCSGDTSREESLSHEDRTYQP